MGETLPLGACGVNRISITSLTPPRFGTAGLALCATLPLSTRPQEFTGPRPDLDELFKEPLELKEGQITLPDRPGLGLEIDEKKLAKALL